MPGHPLQDGSAAQVAEGAGGGGVTGVAVRC